MTMLILSCEKFSDLWDGHVKLLNQNWPDREMETYIVTDAPTQKKLPGVQIIDAGIDTEWSDRLLFALMQVKTDFVFITLDDYYLINRVNSSQIEELLSLMVSKQYDYIRLFRRPDNAQGKEIPGFPKVYEVDTSLDYSVNLYSGIWRKTFLVSTIREPKNAWEFEVSLPGCAREYNAKCAVSRRKEFEILDVVRKGKLLHSSSRYFKKHPGIYEGGRPVNTLEYEIKLNIQIVVARYSPLWLKNKLKAVMRRRGKTFYSDNQ